jgi:hypothetical protein
MSDAESDLDLATDFYHCFSAAARLVPQKLLARCWLKKRIFTLEQKSASDWLRRLGYIGLPT